MMKRILLSFVLISIIISAKAYEFDVILTTSRQQILCYIIEQNDDEISYVLYHAWY